MITTVLKRNNPDADNLVLSFAFIGEQHLSSIKLNDWMKSVTVDVFAFYLMNNPIINTEDSAA